jgi:hypothetical protein
MPSAYGRPPATTYLADCCRDLTGLDASALGVRTLLGGGEPGLGQPEIRDKIRRGWVSTTLVRSWASAT